VSFSVRMGALRVAVSCSFSVDLWNLQGEVKFRIVIKLKHTQTFPVSHSFVTRARKLWKNSK
jgi:hypothetical protein